MKKWIAITSVVEEGVLKKRVLLRKVWCVRGACVVCRLFESLGYESASGDVNTKRYYSASSFWH